MKYAESILDIGRLPLRRRDRAAMALALECCRRNRPRWCTPGEAANVRVHAAMTALGMSDAVAMSVWDALADTRVSQARHVRARLALLLRCLLRVDAGNLPWWRCPEHGRRVTFDWSEAKNREEWWCASCCKWFVTEMYPPTRHVRPLWQDAPGGQR